MTPAAPLPAILLGGGPIAVPVARSLGRAGVPVIGLGHHTDPVQASRHCDRFVDVGAGDGVEERWWRWLTDPGSPRGVVLACADDALDLIARRRRELEAEGHRPMEAADDVVLAMLDKQRTYDLARRVGVPAPRTASLDAGADLAAATAGMAFPVAIKPRHSHLFARHFGLARKLFLARDLAELRELHGEVSAAGLGLLVTEVIPGPDDAYHSYYTYLDERGEPLLHLTKQKLRQYPPRFGLATYHRIHRDREVMELGLRFFQGVGLRGLGNVEFKRDERDGRLVLIECNARFTAGHEVVRHAGIDLGLLAYNRVTGGPLPPVGSYRTGVRMWHPVEDLRTFTLRRAEGTLTFRAWAGSLLHRQHFPLFSWRDPGPSLFSWRRFPGRALARVGRRDR